MSDADKLEARLTDLDETIAEELSGTFDPVTLARAMRERAYTLVELDRAEEADEAFRALQQTLGDENADPVVDRELRRGAYDAAGFLWNRERWPACLDALEEFIQRWGGDHLSGDLDLVAGAYRMKADSLRQLGRPEEALVVSDANLDRFEEEDDLGVQEEIDRTLTAKGMALMDMRRPGEALSVWRALIGRHSGEPSDLWPSIAWNARVNEAGCLAQLDRDAEAAKMCEELLDRYLSDPEGDWHQTITYLAEVREGLLDTRPPAEIVAIVDRLLRRAYQGPEAPLRREAPALINLKVWALLLALQVDEALRLSDELVEAFRRARDPEVIGLAAKALVYQAEILLFHERFSRQRRKFALSIAVRLADGLGVDSWNRQPQGRLASTIALRTKLRDQTVYVCAALRDRLRGRADPELQEVYAEAGIVCGQAWGGSLHVARCGQLLMSLEELGPAAPVVYTRLADSYRRAGAPPHVVIGFALMGALVDDDEQQKQRVDTEMAALYGGQRSLTTKVWLWLTRAARD